MPDQTVVTISGRFRKIEHIVALMLENRSYDHLLGAPQVNGSTPFPDGLTGTESNLADPNDPASAVTVRPAAGFTMPFDPGHEFSDVAVQLYGPGPGPITDPAPLSGFVWDAFHPQVPNEVDAPAKTPADAQHVMDYFTQDKLQVMSFLAKNFAVISSWYSSLPGPTWPNRFFVHAATSGGLTDSPTSIQVIGGYTFLGGTIYDKLNDDWRIYHDGMPQSAGIVSLRKEYIDPFTNNFSDMSNFQGDVDAQNLPSYTFIEPRYETGQHYQGQGNSMHPMNDVRTGETLVKRVYEKLRNSPYYWPKTMLVITFDEHGGFYDHKSPPATVGTGDDVRYSTKNFHFDRLGIRVPAIVVSAYTDPVSITDQVFDHSSLLATVELRFSLPPLTNRDANAKTFDGLVLTRDNVRPDAPTSLPNPAPDIVGQAQVQAPDPNAPMSANQQTFFALAQACDLQLQPPAVHPAIWAAAVSPPTQADALAYIQTVEAKISARRQAAAAAAPRSPA